LEEQMLKRDKERIVAELTDRFRSAQTLIVTDYRGLSVTEIDDLRTKLLEHGVRYTVVKNTLTKLAAEQAGTQELVELLDGPTAIAFLEEGTDPVAAAKVLNEAANVGRVLVVRGGLLDGRPMTEAEVKRLASLPPAELLRAQLVGGLSAPLTQIVGIFTAPLRDLVGILDARIEQLKEQGEAAEAAPEAEASAQAPEGEAPAEASEDEAPAEPEAQAEEQPEAEVETAAHEAGSPAEPESAPEFPQESEEQSDEPSQQAAKAEQEEQ
jgi:large subunit ribosomal protein L10